MSTHAWHDATGVNALAAIDLYPDQTSDAAQTGPIYHDDVRLSQVPEPITLALPGLGGLALFWGRKNQ